MAPIVDTHQHLWDLNILQLDWLNEEPCDRLAQNYLLDDYASAIRGYEISKTSYIEVDVHPKQFLTEAETVLELCRRDDNPMVAAVFGGRPSAANFGDYVARFRDDPHVKGIRQCLVALPPNECLQEGFIAGVRLLGELGLIFDIEAPAEQMEISAKLCDTCPDTRFILDHCGHPEFQSSDISVWQRDVVELAKRDNIVVKISGILAHAKSEDWTVVELAPSINHLLDVFGPDRVMFGSDWPVVTINGTFSRWMDALVEIVADRPADEQRKLFHDNAIRVYGL